MQSHSVDGGNIEDIDLDGRLSSYSKHVGSRLSDAHRELTKRDLMVNDISLSFERTRNVHCHFVDRSNIGDTNLTNLLSSYSKHVGGRSTGAHRELMDRDSMV